ncbi:MAG: ABC transporter ATP-binding protein [Chloroflexota bacterium]
MADLTLENVTKRFGAVTAVKELTLSTPEHEVLVLLGPSGCGKTTTLRMIAGLEEPDSGTIAFDGQPLQELAPKDRPVAFMRQSYALYPHLTVYENLALWARLRGLPAAEIEQRIVWTAERLGLRELLERKPRQLTGGQRMRVALGRTLVRRPAVYLLDEPLANLDAKLRVQTRAEMLKLNKELQATMVYATHDTHEAMAMGHRIAVLRDGQVQQIATPHEIYDQPANMFVAGFVGSPAMNFFRSELRHSGDQLQVDTGAFAVAAPPSFASRLAAYPKAHVILGLRPDDLYDRAVAPPSPSFSAARMQVNVVEYLGRDVVIYLLAGADNPVARVDSRTRVQAGDNIDVLIDGSRMHLFDPDSQQAIAGPARSPRWGVDLGQQPV